MTKILIKRISSKVLIPKYETSGSSGMDISAHIEKDIEILPGESIEEYGIIFDANSERFFVTTSRDQVSAKSFSATQRDALLLAILSFKYSES